MRVRKVRQEHGLTHQVKPAVFAGSSKHSCACIWDKLWQEHSLTDQVFIFLTGRRAGAQHGLLLAGNALLYRLATVLSWNSPCLHSPAQVSACVYFPAHSSTEVQS